jgi:hypothetical protein
MHAGEMAQLFPSWGIGVRQVEASSFVLFDRGYFRQQGMEFAIMAKDDPSFRRYL